jgi:hypothetical protein
MAVTKNTFKNIVAKNIDEESLNLFNDIILRVNKIVFHTYNFITMYFIYLYDHRCNFPLIDDNFVKAVMLIKHGTRPVKKYLGKISCLWVWQDYMLCK